MEIKEKIVGECLAYVKNVFATNYPIPLPYHNLEHTLRVFQATKDIAQSNANVSQQDILCLQIAALFHDISYHTGRENHEENSIKIAFDFLAEKGLNDIQLLQIEKLILVTRMGAKPNGLLEEIMQDADLSNLGQKGYEKSNYTNPYTEFTKSWGEKMSKEEWRMTCIQFMEKHSYHTPYAINNLESQKQKNIAKLKLMDKENNIANSSSKEEKKVKKGKKKVNRIFLRKKSKQCLE